MIFTHALTIPANTPATVPVSAHLEMAPGTVETVWVGFPHGCFGLAGVQLWRGESLILPFTGGAWLAWNNYVYEMPMRLRLDDEPLRFRVVGYNDDDSYAHTITVMVSVALFEIGEIESVGGVSLEDIYAELGV